MKRYLLIFFAIILAGCMQNTTNVGKSQVDRSQLMLVSSDEINEASAKVYSDVIAQAKASNTLNKDPKLTKRVRDISNKLIAKAPYFREDSAKWNWEVNVITSDTINAWCMAGGKIAVYTAIVEKLKLNDDEIAFILAHEIAHALREHVREQQSQELVKNGLISVASMFGVDNTILGVANVAANVGISLPFSRSHESESDEIGLELSYMAGYNPDAAASLWRKMQEHSGDGGFEFLSTHPSHESRIENLEKLAAKLKAKK